MWCSTPRKSLFDRSAAILAALVVFTPFNLFIPGELSAQVVPRGAQTVPTIAYDAALAALANGDFAVASRIWLPEVWR